MLKIGMRTIKTGISVFFCILLSFLLQRETYVVAAITAVFTIREDMQNTIKFGKHRIVGNILGALTSVVVITIFNIFGDSQLVQLLAIPSVIILMIGVLSNLGYHEGTVGGCATLLTILFMIPSTKSYSYAFARVVDSIMGMTIALLVNRVLPNRHAKHSKCQQAFFEWEKIVKWQPKKKHNIE
ncbi:aromatic acid exporter family protein [Vagococcus intermedius]|uniref:Aromatic acid exporter family protein n=2 Tax=Vagococcus intermedius TaxID=2991418 RepID=A0AAF0I7V9_9ENTE|nr:aromatic acid exporter family protein [Vagococcus intermedius]WEG73619.1 aromatic acid exporter family protein [Vagococcus intermedius]WEG75703.1 aromatic acid exporter family protein [Vagococcus intermedius]